MQTTITIRLAREEDFDAVARIWFESWKTTGLPSSANIDVLRARIPREIANGWQLYAADEGGRVVAMLAIVAANKHLDQIFVAPDRMGQRIGRQLLAFAREKMPDEIWLRTAVANVRAVAWYEREGFVKEREELQPGWPLPRAYYRWKR
jgi:ribosomal protein S18 acetylase RimI-like enzyme